MTEKCTSEPSCEIYGNGKTIAIKHNLNGGAYATVLNNLHLVSYSVELPNRDISPFVNCGRLWMPKMDRMATINMEFKILDSDITQMYDENGDIDIMFRQETEKLLTQAYKQIKARSKR